MLLISTQNGKISSSQLYCQCVIFIKVDNKVEKKIKGQFYTKFWGMIAILSQEMKINLTDKMKSV